MTYAQAQEHARKMMGDPMEREFLEFLIYTLCGVGQSITAVTDADRMEAVGKYNAGIAIKELME